MAVYTLFGQPASPGTPEADSASYTMGVQISVSESGYTLTGVWFYSGTGAASLPSQIALYSVSGQALVHSEAASWSGATGAGWVRAAFASPPALTASTAYIVAVFNAGGTGNWYTATANYWTTGAGSAGITSGPLTAPNNATAANGQDVFNTAVTLAFPATTYNATNYWIDAEVTSSAPDSATVTPAEASGSGAAYPAAAAAATVALYAGAAAGLAGSWANTPGAVGGTQGDYATWTSASPGGSGTLELSSFGLQAQVPAGSVIGDVTAVIRHGETPAAQMASLTAQVYAGTTPKGSPVALSLADAVRDEQVTFTGLGLTWADLADLRVRLVATRT